MFRHLLPILTALPLLAHAQTPMSDQEVKDQMKFDVQYLASDRLEGREAGTNGERLAADYVRQKFESIGLMPYGDSTSYLQRFPFMAPPRVGDKCSLQVGRKRLKQGEEYFPLDMSASGAVLTKLMKCGYGIQAPDLGYDDYEGVDVKGRAAAFSISSPDGIHPHSKYLTYHDLRARVEKAVQLGAVAVILYNNDPTADPPSPEMSDKAIPVGVPVVYIVGDLYKQVIETGNPVAVNVDIVREERTAMNVIGMIDNGKPNTVVIGAHFDHLGLGGKGSLYTGDPAIHNGADDNASGTAALIELGRDLRIRGPKHNNYLLLAFSGEEKGLLGSNYYVKHPTVDLTKVNYMLNMDMVGRLKKDEPVLILSGTGTSPRWKTLVDSIETDQVEIKATESGVGPSDHTSFYLQNIPVLHFFSGTHADYHKPSDDEDKINYPGALAIIGMIRKTIALADGSGKLVFTKTKDESNEDAPKFKVTLGVVPDYAFDGEGMRIDGVSDGKPAQKAGLLAGDVVVQIGDYKVVDMMSYMKALGKFTKGETTTVKVKRGAEMLEKSITF